MAVKPAHVTYLALAIRWGLMLAALVALFALEWVILGFSLVTLGLAFGIALRFARFREWFTGLVTRSGPPARTKD